MAKYLIPHKAMIQFYDFKVKNFTFLRFTHSFGFLYHNFHLVYGSAWNYVVLPAFGIDWTQLHA